MKTISLNNILGAQILSAKELKNIMGGDDEFEMEIGGSSCSKDSNGLCGANCKTSTGAAAKCGGSSCTCGG